MNGNSISTEGINHQNIKIVLFVPPQLAFE